MGAAPFPRSGKRKRALLISKLRANERRHPRGDRAGHATAPAPGAAAHNAASLPRPAAHLPPPATSAAFPASAPASPSASAPAAPPAAPPATSNLIPRAATTLHHYQPSHCHLPPPPTRRPLKNHSSNSSNFAVQILPRHQQKLEQKHTT